MIKITNITKKFGENVIFENLNLEIESGQLVAITGKSGCGKTTLLNLIGMIDTKYEGKIEYDNVMLHSMKNSQKQKFISDNINYLFQNYALIDDKTVLENLELALFYEKLNKQEKKDIILKSLEAVGLPMYEEKKVYTLSGGEQQRVSLARVIIKKGNIILADEPTGNLDEENRNIVLNNLIELNKQGKTVIIVTHDPYVAEKCNKIISL